MDIPMDAIEDAVAVITALSGDDWDAARSLDQRCEPEDLALAGLYVGGRIAKWAAAQLGSGPSAVMQAVALEFATLGEGRGPGPGEGSN